MFALSKNNPALHLEILIFSVNEFKYFYSVLFALGHKHYEEEDLSRAMQSQLQTQVLKLRHDALNLNAYEHLPNVINVNLSLCRPREGVEVVENI